MQAHYHKVQYYETDAMGIVHHSNYLRFIEEARNEFTNQSALPYAEVEKAGYLCPVAASHCKYQVAARFGDVLKIITKCESYNGVRLVYSYRIENMTTGALCLTSETEHCFVDRDMKIVQFKKCEPQFYEILCSMVGVSAED